MPDLDLSYHIDPDSLREIPNRPEDMRQAVADYRAEADQYIDQPARRIAALGMAGTLARITGDLALARTLLTEAVALAEQHSLAREAFVQRIRLAHVYQWAGEFSVSTPMFEALLTAPQPGYEDFVLQHAGKNAFDRGDYPQALDYFRRALALREAKGQPDLIDSTRTAIAAAQRRMG